MFKCISWLKLEENKQRWMFLSVFMRVGESQRKPFTFPSISLVNTLPQVNLVNSSEENGIVLCYGWILFYEISQLSFLHSFYLKYSPRFHLRLTFLHEQNYYVLLLSAIRQLLFSGPKHIIFINSCTVCLIQLKARQKTCFITSKFWNE